MSVFAHAAFDVNRSYLPDCPVSARRYRRPGWWTTPSSSSSTSSTYGLGGHANCSGVVAAVRALFCSCRSSAICVDGVWRLELAGLGCSEPVAWEPRLTNNAERWSAFAIWYSRYMTISSYEIGRWNARWMTSHRCAREGQ